MRKIIVLLLLMLAGKALGQNLTDVYESTVKIEEKSTQEYMCGLAEGDQLVFSFEEVKGKKLDKLEIMEYPSYSRFADCQTSKIEEKKITVPNTGIYVFRFTNSAGSPRVCRYKIQRIPADEQYNRFNTTVYWKTVNDTTFYNEGEHAEIVTDTVITKLTDKVVKVHAAFNTEGNRLSFNFAIPPRTIAFSYYIGVNQPGNKAFVDAAGSLMRSAGPLVSQIPGYGPLAALALNGTSFLTTMASGETVKYWITDAVNGNLFNVGKSFKYIKQGNVVNDFSRLAAPLKDMYFVCLQNDNKIQGIDVTVKITAVSLRDHKVVRPMRKFKLESKTMPYLKN